MPNHKREVVEGVMPNWFRHLIYRAGHETLNHVQGDKIEIATVSRGGHEATSLL